MQRKNGMIGLASLVGAVLFAGSALAVVAVFSPLVTSMCGAARASNIPSSRKCRPTRGFRSPDAFRIIPGAALWLAA